MDDINKQKLYNHNYIYDNLKTLKEQEFLRLCMPGHKGIMPDDALDAAYDITEIGENDDLHSPFGVIKRSQERAAEVFDAGYTFFITEGATSAIHIMLAAIGPGKLVLAGDFHKSVIYGMGLAGITPVFCDADEASVRSALANDKKIMGALITSPDYYGRCLDIKRLSSVVKSFGRLLLIDEAHGSHFYFGDFPPTAAGVCADIWVNSLHKTLPCLTQSAILNIGKESRVPYCDARKAMYALHTSSPSYLVMASIERGVNAMLDMDTSAWTDRCLRVMDEIDALEGFKCVRVSDPARIVVNTTGRGLNGFSALEGLKRLGVLCEMADDDNIVLLTANVDFERRLLKALAALPQKPPIEPIGVASVNAEARRGYEYPMSIREAMLSKSELADMSRAIGRVSACAAGMYPPGTPYVIPGQRIDESAARLLSQKRTMFGLDEGRLTVIK